MKKVINKIYQTINDFDLIQNNDKIAIAVSGGKDSLTLVLALKVIQKMIMLQKDIKFEIIALNINMKLCADDYSILHAWFKEQNIYFEVIDTKIGEILKQNMNNGKLKCSLCSKLRKGILIERALELNCNKIAFGHHGDDAIETLFMNLIFNGKIATFPPKLYLDRKKVTMIRPMIKVREDEIIKFSKYHKLPIQECGCPMSDFTQRYTMKLFLKNQIYQNQNFKTAYENFLVALDNEKEIDLWSKKKDKFNF